jgi:hypothetical protein
MFPLLRYFSIACAIVLAVGTIVVASVFTDVTKDQLIAQREASNVALTKAFSNSIWPLFRDHVRDVADLDGDQLRRHEGTARFYDAVHRLTDGLSIVKIKVYALNGNTVFSSQASQLGADKSSKPGFIKASNGQVATEISHRDVFSAFEQQAFDIDVVSSYVPIYDRNGEIEGVFEVYDDVTSTLAGIHEQRDWTILFIGGLFTALYLLLFLIVLHAEKLMRRQHEDILKAKASLAEANADLATEVVTRKETEQALNKSMETLQASETEARKLLAQVTETTEALAMEKE